MPRASWKHLSKLEVPWPGEAEAEILSDGIGDVRSAAQSALAEIHVLSAIRDVLLPQLMSGKLRVKDAEKVVAAAV
jgi:type I restriction enzyme S subunit